MAADHDKLRRIVMELEQLAANDQLTMTRFFELAMDASEAGAVEHGLSEKIDECETRIVPDWPELLRLASEVRRLGELGALTPMKLDLLYERALVAVGERADLLELFPEFRGRSDTP